MMRETCYFQKYGFCKNGANCDRKHLKEVCQENKTCRSSRTCEKRHPKVCKRFYAEGFCFYGRDCAYLHSEVKTNTRENEELKEKVKFLEEALTALTLTVSNLQGQVLGLREQSWSKSYSDLNFDSVEDNEVEDTKITKQTKISEQ